MISHAYNENVEINVLDLVHHPEQSPIEGKSETTGEVKKTTRRVALLWT